MVLATSLSESWRVFFSIDSKEQKLIMPLIECDIASYADNNTPYNFDCSLDNETSNLEKSTNSPLNWFRENQPTPINVIS